VSSTWAMATLIKEMQITQTTNNCNATKNDRCFYLLLVRKPFPHRPSQTPVPQFARPPVLALRNKANTHHNMDHTHPNNGLTNRNNHRGLRQHLSSRTTHQHLIS
jgi:hypothetical protein